MTTMELRKTACRAAPATRASGGSLLRAAVEMLFAWQERWEQRQHLKALDDHLLRDMGLSRLDAAREADKPFWRI